MTHLEAPFPQDASYGWYAIPMIRATLSKRLDLNSIALPTRADMCPGWHQGRHHEHSARRQMVRRWDSECGTEAKMRGLATGDAGTETGRRGWPRRDAEHCRIPIMSTADSHPYTQGTTPG